MSYSQDLEVRRSTVTNTLNVRNVWRAIRNLMCIIKTQGTSLIRMILIIVPCLLACRSIWGSNILIRNGRSYFTQYLLFWNFNPEWKVGFYSMHIVLKFLMPNRRSDSILCILFSNEQMDRDRILYLTRIFMVNRTGNIKN